MSRCSSKIGIKPHCKVCQDSGLPESIYSKHNTRGPGGKVTCMTLLNATCSKCKKSGHTQKFCTVQEKTDLDKCKYKPYNTPPSVAPKNSFASLVSSEDDEPVKKKALEMDWAALSDDEEEEPAELIVRIKRNLSKEY